MNLECDNVVLQNVDLLHEVVTLHIYAVIELEICHVIFVPVEDIIALDLPNLDGHVDFLEMHDIVDYN